MAFWNRKTITVSSDDGLRGRLSKAISGGNDNADTLHNVYLDYGYPSEINFSNFWNMYRRFGIARNVVELVVDTGWMSVPTVEADDKFEQELEKLIIQVKLWDRVKSLDTRQRVGRYAGMFVRVRDDKKPSEPIEPGSLKSVEVIVSLMPLYESQLRVSATETDPTSDNFGMPTMYEFNGGVVGNRNTESSASFGIHPDRIIIASEGADNGGIYGISSLEAPYNSLMDLRKIIGAGGEGFYKNAAQNIIFELQDSASAKSNKPLLEKFNEMVDDFMANRFRRSMWTPGMTAKVLEANIPKPKEYFDVALNDVAAATKIPATILIGQQTGRLASSEDSRHFLSGVNSRNENFVTELISDHLDWFINMGVLPPSDYEIEFDDLLALSQQEKLLNSEKMSKINETQFKAGDDRPFTSAEIREEAGFDPDELVETDDGEDIDDVIE